MAPEAQERSIEALTLADLGQLDFEKGLGLMPAIVQHAHSAAVLMLGYMNREALLQSLTRRRVVFFSRRRGALWEKGERSGHTLELIEVRTDCDRDALLVRALPRGPTCHTGTASCFGSEAATAPLAFLETLEDVIGARLEQPQAGSYTARLAGAGSRRVAQKVGEEGVELALAGAAGSPGEVIAEAADLVFHLMLLLKVRGVPLAQVAQELARRHAARESQSP